VPPGCGTQEIKDALTSVGFSEQRAAAAVSELSGGWRMKLAIARSMLWNADLLLLDEVCALRSMTLPLHDDCH
jgi:ATPase subunit of ABC transporter with duplicated ATPase domains